MNERYNIESMTEMVSELTLNSLKEEYNRLFSDNKELLESALYAASVQQALLPQRRHFERCFDDYFVIYKPMQIIGGDLFWVGQKNGVNYFAAADCSGHGISGALLSVLAVSFLNYVILSKDQLNLAQIIEEIDKKWLETFNKDHDALFDNDWMELTLCSFDTRSRELKFAGANNNLFIVTKGELSTIEGDPFPIGGWQIEKKRLFEEKSFIIEENSMLYLGSDGFKDQFGGPSNKRYMRKRLREFLLKIFEMPCEIQKQMIENEFQSWRGKQPQTDDMCIMGIRI